MIMFYYFIKRFIYSVYIREVELEKCYYFKCITREQNDLK